VGWAGRVRITPRLKELAVKLSTELSFARAAEILSYLVPVLSPMTIWQVTQEIGEILRQEGKEKKCSGHGLSMFCGNFPGQIMLPLFANPFAGEPRRLKMLRI